MSNQHSDLNFLTKIDFPPYAVASVEGSYVVLAGGGGSAKTGIKNKFEVYSLHQTSKGATTARLVVSHDVGEYCISNMAAWATTQESSSNLRNTIGKSPGCSEFFKRQVDKGIISPCSEVFLALGKEENCTIYKLSPRILSEQANGDCHSEPADDDNKDKTARRRNRKSSQSQDQSTVGEGKKSTANDPPHSSLGARMIYTVEQICSFQTVFRQQITSSSKKSPGSKLQRTEDIYQKTCKVSQDRKSIITAGTDGKVRIWDLTCLPASPKLLRTIDAHTKEVDQLDISWDNKHVVSICKLTRECCIWDLNTGNKVIQLALNTPGLKYKFGWARYSCVEGKLEDMRLFTVSNPATGSKNPGIVSKWCGQKYSLDRTQRIPGVLSNLAVSDDGRYLATGTMDGDVIILISFSLQKLQRLSSVHSTFITGLDWLSTRTRSSCIARGFSDASVLSISPDNCLNITHVPQQTMLPVWAVALLSVLVLMFTFILASYVGL